MSEVKWSGGDIINFLNIYRKYQCLWDITCPDYLKREVKRQAFAQLMQELEYSGLPVQEDGLKKKIKVIRDSYRNELNKIKKSQKSGAGTDDIYKPKLVWFSAADSFWNAVISGRQSSSNLDMATLTQGQEDLAYLREDVDVSVSEVEVEQTSTVERNKTQSVGFTPKRACASPAPRATKTVKSNCTTKYPSRFESALNKLKGIADIASEGMQVKAPSEDQYDNFAKHIATQLRELPLRSFILLQHKFQEMITQERLAQLDQIQPLPPSIPSNNSGFNIGDPNLYNQRPEHLNTEGLDIVQQALVNIGD